MAVKRIRFGDLLAEFRLHYSLSEADVAALYPLNNKFKLSARDINDIEHGRFRLARSEDILNCISESLMNFEHDQQDEKKFVNAEKTQLLKKAAVEYANPQPVFQRAAVGIPKDEVFRQLSTVVNIPYLASQLGLSPENAPKNLPSLLKAVRKFLGYSQRSLVEEKGDKHSVTYHKMERDSPHNTSHEFVESLSEFIAVKMKTRTFRDVIEAVSTSGSVAVGLMTDCKENHSFDFEVMTHNNDFSRVHGLEGCRGRIVAPANSNSVDPQAHFTRAYRFTLRQIIDAAGGPHFYESEMAKRALDITLNDMRRKFPGIKIEKFRAKKKSSLPGEVSNSVSSVQTLAS